jgi:hypothetical protein
MGSFGLQEKKEGFDELLVHWENFAWVFTNTRAAYLPD